MRLPWLATQGKVQGWLAVTIDPTRLAYVHAQFNGAGRPKVLRFGAQGLEPGAGHSDRAARDLHADRFQCVTVLRPGEFQVLTIEAPKVPPNELKNATRWRIKDMIDYHIDDATVDLLDIPPQDGDSRSHSMFAVSAHNDVIQGCIRRFEEAKVPLVAIDIPETAQRNIGTLYEQEERGIAVLHVEQETSLLTVNYRKELYLTRRMDIGLKGLANPNTREDALNRVTLELQRTFDHFDRQFRFASISRLMVAPLPEEVGLMEQLAANLSIPVAAIDLREVMEFGGEGAPDLATQWQLFHLFGGSLRHEGKVL